MSDEINKGPLERVVGRHTPGPWTLSGANTVHGPDCIVAFVGTADETVRMFSAQRQSADALLIAAAPDLLEALRAVDVLFGHLASDCTQYDWLDRARAAVAKALGVPPNVRVKAAARQGRRP